MPSRARAWGLAQGAALGGLVGICVSLLGLPGILGLNDRFLPALVGALLGALLVRLGCGRALTAAAAGALALVLLLAYVPWTPLADRWVRSDPLPPAGASAIVVLSSGVSRDSLLYDAGMDRLLTGLELLRAGVAPRLVTTRVVHWFDGTRVTTDPDQARLVHLAGADSAWLVVDSVAVTRDEATGAARLLLPLGARDVVVVTAASHTRRACSAFERVGFRVWCRPARERERRTAHGTTPEQRLTVFAALLYELLGTVKYRYQAWI